MHFFLWWTVNWSLISAWIYKHFPPTYCTALTAHPSFSWPVNPITPYSVDTSSGCWCSAYSIGKWVTFREQLLPQHNRTPQYTSQKHSHFSPWESLSLPKPANMTAVTQWFSLPSLRSCARMQAPSVVTSQYIDLALNTKVNWWPLSASSSLIHKMHEVSPTSLLGKWMATTQFCRKIFYWLSWGVVSKPNSTLQTVFEGHLTYTVKSSISTILDKNMKTGREFF